MNRVLNHICERKRRYYARNDKATRMAFNAFQRFYKTKMGARIAPDINKFEDSAHYTAFINFGRWIVNNNVLNPLGYMDYLLMIEQPMSRWQEQPLYETYVRELTKSETPQDAMERNFALMEAWAMDSGHEWTDFFNDVSTNQAALWIRSGRLSPWILLTAPTAQKLIERFNSEQLEMLAQSIDLKFWSTKFERHKVDVAILRETFDEINL